MIGLYNQSIVKICLLLYSVIHLHLCVVWLSPLQKSVNKKEVIICILLIFN